MYDKLIIDLLNPILDRIAPAGRILDAGGGTGKWSVYFAQMGFEVELLDISSPMLEFAADRIRNLHLSDLITITQGSISSLPFMDHSFDFVFSERNPISHSGKQETSYKAVMEMYRVLKPAGFFWGCVLNRIRKVAQLVTELDFKRAQELLVNGWMPRSPNEYTYYYMENELINLLEQTVFHHVHIYPTTAMAEWIPSAWLLGDQALNNLLKIEKMVRELQEAKSYGVRLYAVAQK